MTERDTESGTGEGDDEYVSPHYLRYKQSQKTWGHLMERGFNQRFRYWCNQQCRKELDEFNDCTNRCGLDITVCDEFLRAAETCTLSFYTEEYRIKFREREEEELKNMPPDERPYRQKRHRKSMFFKRMTTSPIVNDSGELEGFEEKYV